MDGPQVPTQPVVPPRAFAQKEGMSISVPCPLCRWTHQVAASERAERVEIVCNQCGLRFSVRSGVPERMDAKGGDMASSEKYSQLEFLERWLSSQPQAPRELGPAQMLWSWCRKQPFIAISALFSILVVLASLSLAIWGWGTTTRDLNHLQRQFQQAQQTLADSQQLLEQQNQQIHLQTDRLRKTETSYQQVQRRYEEALTRIQELETRCQTIQAERISLHQQLQTTWALHLARRAHDLVLVQPRHSLFLASEAARIYLGQGHSLELSLEQTLRDALAQVNIWRLEGHQAPVAALAFSHSGHWLLSGSEDQTLRLWNVGGSGPPSAAEVVRAHTGAIRVVLLTLDERRLITAGQDGRVLLWDLTSEASGNQPSLLGTQEGPILAGAISSDGRWLVTGGGSLFQKDYTAKLWDLNTDPPGAQPIVLRGHERPIRSVAISPDLRWVATAGEDKTIRLYHLQSRYPAAEQRVLSGHAGAVTRLAISSSGRWLVSSGCDGKVRVWNLQGSDPSKDSILLPAHSAPVEAVAIHPQERWIAVGTGDGTLQIWDLESPHPSKPSILLKGHEGAVHCVAFTPDGHTLLSGSADRTVRLWNLSASDPNQAGIILRGHQSEVRLMALSRDGRLLATACEETPESRDYSLRIWHLRREDLLDQARQTTAQLLSPEQQEAILTSLRPSDSTPQ